MGSTEPHTPRAQSPTSPASPQAPTAVRTLRINREEILPGRTTRSTSRVIPTYSRTAGKSKATPQARKTTKETQTTKTQATKTQNTETQATEAQAKSNLNAERAKMALINMPDIPPLVEYMKKELSQQKELLQLLQQGQEDAKKERETLITQNKALQKQVIDLTEKVDKISHELKTTRQQQPQQRNWARVAALPPTVPPPQSYHKQSGNSLRVMKITTTQLQTDQDTSDNQLKRDMPQDEAAKQISDALKECDNTKDVEILGVGSTKTGYLIRFRTDKGKETAEKNTEWVEKLGEQTKITHPRYGIVAHLTLTEEI